MVRKEHLKNHKISSKQSLHLGATFAGVVHDLGPNSSDFDEVRALNHPMWTQIREVVRKNLPSLQDKELAPMTFEPIHPQGEFVQLVSEPGQFEIGPTDGTRFFESASGLFPGGMFAMHAGEWPTAPKTQPVPTEKTSLSFYQPMRDGFTPDYFCDISGDLENLVLTEHQVITFVLKYGRILRANQLSTYFLVRDTADETGYGVVDVDVNHNHRTVLLQATLRPYDDPEEWGGGHDSGIRLVVPDRYSN